MKSFPPYRIILIIVFHCCICLLSTFAQDSLTVNQQNDCLHYGPTLVTLIGTTDYLTFPGPPNFKSIADGDSTDKCTLLNLESPICVSKDPTDTLGLNTYESNVKQIQLIYSLAHFSEILVTSGKIKVTGTLLHSHTSHHHTPILLEVFRMVSLTKRNVN